MKISIRKRVFNDHYYPYLTNKDRYLVFYGGGSSGKSYFIGQKLIYHLISASRENVLVVRNTGDTNRKSTYPLLKSIVKQWGLSQYFKFNESDLRIRCTLTGNEVVFAGLDDVEKIKSITFENGELTTIWVEEATECEEDDINQLQVRLRGGNTRKQMILSFNPINVSHWIKRHFIDSGLATVCFSTYKDNKFLTDEDRRSLEAFKDTDPYYYQVYCLGEWGIIGDCFFNAEIVQKRIEACPKPIKQGYFTYKYDGLHITDISFIDDPNGLVKIYREPKGKYTVIGADTSGDGSDYNVAQVLDKEGNQIATMRQQTDEDLFVKQLYCLGMHFNGLIAVEVNFSSYQVNELQRLEYPHLYVRENAPDQMQDGYMKRYGFRTTALTRPLILSNLVEIVREHSEKLNDVTTLNEMLTFSTIKGKPQAQEGCHDDCVMSLAIAYEAISQIPRDRERTRARTDSFFAYGS